MNETLNKDGIKYIISRIVDRANDTIIESDESNDDFDILIMAAAVCDFKAKNKSESKTGLIPKGKRRYLETGPKPTIAIEQNAYSILTNKRCFL